MQTFTITLTLTEDPEDRNRPDLRISTKGTDVHETHFALVSKTLKDLAIAGLEEKLQVAVNLAELHRVASNAGGFDEDEE